MLAFIKSSTGLHEDVGISRCGREAPRLVSKRVVCLASVWVVERAPSCGTNLLTMVQWNISCALMIMIDTTAAGTDDDSWRISRKLEKDHPTPIVLPRFGFTSWLHRLRKTGVLVLPTFKALLSISPVSIYYFSHLKQFSPAVMVIWLMLGVVTYNSYCNNSFMRGSQDSLN